MGFASALRVAVRYRLDPGIAHELLLDFEVRGWVQHSSLGDRSGWSMTNVGRTENERHQRFDGYARPLPLRLGQGRRRPATLGGRTRA